MKYYCYNCGMILDFWLAYQEIDHDLNLFVEIYDRFRSKHDVQSLIIEYSRFSALVEKIQTMMNMGLQDTIISKLLNLDVEPVVIKELMQSKVQWWKDL